MTDLLKTPLYFQHLELNAKIVDFGGWALPVNYGSQIEEHHAVRKSVGVFDVSHMGEFLVKGNGSTELIQKVTSNNVTKLSPGEAQYSCLPNHNGGIVDDLLVYRLEDEDNAPSYMLVVNASNIEKDWNWIKEHNDAGVSMENISYRCGLLAVQGPKAIETLQSLTTTDLSSIKYYDFKIGTLAGVNDVIISATGYTGSGGFELYADNEQLPKIWDAVMQAGKPFDIQPAGLGARDTLRLEMGFCLYGNDINDNTSPIEAGLGWITKTKKEHFPSIEIFRKQRAEGISKKLIGFVMEDRRVPRHGYKIENSEGEIIGEVTSGTQAPSLDKPIGMGYVQMAYVKEGTALLIAVGKKKLSASVVKPPFYKN